MVEPSEEGRPSPSPERLGRARLGCLLWAAVVVAAVVSVAPALETAARLARVILAILLVVMIVAAVVNGSDSERDKKR